MVLLLKMVDLYYILYINDMEVSDLLRFIIFTGDTNMFYMNKDADMLVYVINRVLLKLTTWF